MWILTGTGDADASVTVRLPAGTSKTIGRVPVADFVVESAMLSRLHCRLSATDEALEVEDLESTNGTFVNESRVDRARLAPGDRLRIGRLDLAVEKQRGESPDAIG